MEPVFHNYHARQLWVITIAGYITWDFYISKLPQLWHKLYFTSKPQLDFYVCKHSQMKLTVQYHNSPYCSYETKRVGPRVTLLTCGRWPVWIWGIGGKLFWAGKKVFRSTKCCLNGQGFVSLVIIINYISTDTITTNSLHK